MDWSIRVFTQLNGELETECGDEPHLSEGGERNVAGADGQNGADANQH